ncbi:SDR family NAD(P)-dependent oxidoreductase [Streptomyces sp. NPDC091292]|uniref:SDR family NAD(P)-dependent oxidoreductase n=1 Tax=Streptomyces sp. NPDC091292 TaxID=3365991 RepID=UPI00381B79F3
MQLHDSSVLVTGGASGLGAATARFLAETERCHVVVMDVQDDLGEQVAKEIGATFVHTDITDPDQVVRAVETALSLAPLRAAVNCAGGGSSARTIGRDGAYDSAHPLDTFARIITLNVVGTFNVTRLAATAMSRNEPGADGDRGAIVNTASVAAFEGQIGQAAYAAAKAGIAGMTLPIARDLSAAGIRVNTIAPGTFATPPMLGVPEQVLTSLGKSVPFPKRLGRPAEFAALAHHLLTNSYVNGETVRLDGGIRLQPK